MHVNNLAITLVSAHNGGDDYKLVLENEVAYTSLVLPAHSREVELQGGGELDEQEEEKTEERPHCETGGRHCQWQLWQWPRGRRL